MRAVAGIAVMFAVALLSGCAGPVNLAPDPSSPYFDEPHIHEKELDYGTGIEKDDDHYESGAPPRHD